MDIAIADLIPHLTATLLSGNDTLRITGFSSLRDARPGDLSFVTSEKYRPELDATQASAVLVPSGWRHLPAGIACLEVANPSRAFEKITEEFGCQPLPFSPGIHPTAVVGQCVDTRLETLKIGPHAVIEDGVHLGDGTEIGAGCFIGRNSSLGRDCRLHPNSTVYEGCVLGDRVILHSGAIIGADGFGYAFAEGRHRKIRQAGIAQLDSDVEVGAGSTIDRARFGRTWVGEGTKIDNQVQIAHNVTIGKHCIVVAQSGIAGSSEIGDYVVIAAQVGVVDHVKIGSRCTVGARSVVTKDLPAGAGVYLGFPAVLAATERRRMAAVRQLPDFLSRLRTLERPKGSGAPQERAEPESES